MSTDLFDRYRDALRRGHVAAARGEMEAATAAYTEAVSLAPDRHVAHVGLGALHLRTGDLRAALTEYDLALARAPRDESALAGRADALTGLGRRVDAAETLDRLADVLEAAGRLPESLDAVRRALALAEGKARRRHAERVMQRLEAAATASRLEAPAAGGTAETESDAEWGAPPGAGTGASTTSVVSGAADDPASGEQVRPHAVGDEEADGAAAVEQGNLRDSTRAVVLAPAIDGVERMVDAEDAHDRGDFETARREALIAAEAFRREGQLAAAIDACYLALTVAPGDPALHLVLVNLYLERGWRRRAAEKLLLLGRLAALDDDEQTRAELCLVAATEFPEDPELIALCA